MIKPCPFCGSAEYVTVFASPVAPRWHVECCNPKCTASVDCCAEEAAIESWNTRYVICASCNKKVLFEDSHDSMTEDGRVCDTCWDNEIDNELELRGVAY